MGEVDIRGWFGQQLSDLKEAIGEQRRLRGIMTIFYLLGPFFMLIERSPADAWLTLCGLAFLVRCVVRRHWSWTKFFWVRAVLFFWVWCLISASLSALPGYSLGEATIWIRFPLFAFASAFWLARDPRILMSMLISMGIGMLIMNCILIAEYIIVGQRSGRLLWPYGDMNPGNYLAKACMPAFCVICALAASKKGRLGGLAMSASILSILVSLITGERINLILRIFSGTLSAVVHNPIWSQILAFLSVIATTIGAGLFFLPGVKERFIHHFFGKLTTLADTGYRRAWDGALDAYFSAPILGIGPDNYRMLCDLISANRANSSCYNHPHNFYLQILGETGIIGLVLAFVSIIAIIWTCFRARLIYRDNVLSATCFVTPLAFFFPLQSTADFFGQWNNVFMWSAIAFSLAIAHQTFIRKSIMD